MEPQYISRIASIRPLIGICLFALALNVPFVNQAFHMDDGLYLLLSRNVTYSPWFPEDMPAYFEGLHAQDLASTEHAWPLTIYVLALCALICRNVSEMGLHLVFLAFPMIIGCSIYYLARRFTHHPVAATLLALSGPVVCVLSHTLMTDIPMLSLWVASAAFFCHGIDKRRSGLIWSGTILVTLACFLSYSGFCLIPLLCLYAALHNARRSILTVLIFPVSAFSVRLVWAYFHYHRLIPEMLLDSYVFREHVLSPALMFQKCSYTILVLGMAGLFPCLFIVLHRKKWITIWVLLVVLIGLAGLAPSHDPAHKAVFAVLFCSGLAALLLAVRSIMKSRRLLSEKDTDLADDLFLGGWLVGVFLFCAFAYMNGSARYVLPAMPALVLILIRLMERILSKRALLWSCAASVALSTSMAIIMAVSDYQFAEIYRSFATNFQRTYRGRENKVWFTGEWGLRAYLERLGAQELGRRDPRPVPGDLLIAPTLATPYETLFSDKLSLHSIILIAPSQLIFEIPPPSDDSELVFTIGMPWHAKSDGMEYSIRFISPRTRRILCQEVLVPGQGQRWQTRRISLKELTGEQGRIVFAAEVGKSGDADADWIAFAHTRICNVKNGRETLTFDFVANLDRAQIEGVPGCQYQTDRNNPVFPMTVWLEQVPAVRLLEKYEYRPDFPIRLLDAKHGAGFWSSGWGLLPLSLVTGRSVLESISVYEITRSAESFGEAIPSWHRQ